MTGQPNVLGIVLAGGEGKRLWPLTADRAKPAVPFAGNYRLVDFVLSNLVNAGFVKLCVLTQYKSHSLDRHISTTWRLSTVLGQYVTPVPAQQRLGPRWYHGSGDAIYQSLNLVNDERPDHVVVFGADHVYRMDPGQMVDQHVATGASVTVAGIRVPRVEAKAFGCIDSDADGRITRFLEKPAEPPHVPDDPEVSFASMGNYVFTTEALIDTLRADAADPDSAHDMGGDIIPALVDQGRAHVYDFSRNVVPGEAERHRGYWRDVGTIDAYYEAHMDLVSADPVFDIYNRSWPIRTATPPLPPAKFVAGGSAEDSMVGPGSIVSGTVHGSIVSSDVVIESGSVVQGSVLLPGVRIGRGAVVRRAILDKNVIVPDGALIGVDPATDRTRYTVSAGGVTVLGKGVTAF
ncbi:glucose-1-phosphate adenylyltransferase [Saccharothrix violaceirubra]|uniref:Glucose-1-phosphate adenylyltransferase n=1 Tax=Saccharothrix violaceirubra TaxID=413306 RepID=A0A7W7T992_9PSEU|nr:glucose-1-phosphate adenylyltransferase [Saccharothrix violaceirubra]MBB4968337.1 glucose-1-phosphate adenylyltransferase [Saccharothrix violaceirubra]